MPTMQSAYDWLRARAAPRSVPKTVAALERPPAELEPGRNGRAEVERLHREIEALVAGSEGTGPRVALDAALGAVARLQVVSANLDANNPPRSSQLERALVGLADRQLQGHADAIERGMTYTADNTMRLLTQD
jgi:hypothetical protein